MVIADSLMRMETVPSGANLNESNRSECVPAFAAQNSGLSPGGLSLIMSERDVAGSELEKWLLRKGLLSVSGGTVSRSGLCTDFA